MAERWFPPHRIQDPKFSGPDYMSGTYPCQELRRLSRGTVRIAERVQSGVTGELTLARS